MHYGASVWELGMVKLGSGKIAVTARHAKGVLSKARQRLKGAIGISWPRDTPRVSSSVSTQRIRLRRILSRMSGR